jgi:hypothetical protein
VSASTLPTDWLAGVPMDPTATPPDPLPHRPGIPLAPDEGCGVVIVGPTGSGRSALMQACLYDAARLGQRCAYLGHEVTREEFDARAAVLAESRGDKLDEELLAALRDHVRYLDLSSVIVQAWDNVERWVADVERSYDVVVIDPASAAGAALGLDFDKSNTDWLRFYDALVQPLVNRGVVVLIPDNVGHAIEAKSRARGASAKGDRADVTFSCTPSANPVGLRITARKVRSVRAPYRSGESWLFVKSSQRIERQEAASSSSTATFRPTSIMEKVSRALEADGGLSKRAIRTAIGGTARNVDLALELLIAEGFVEARTEGQAHRHYSINAYHEAADEATVSSVSDPCRDRGADTVPSTVSDRGVIPVGDSPVARLGSDAEENGSTVSRLFEHESGNAILGDGGVAA